MRTVSKKEVQDLIKGNSELATKTRLELLKDQESELFKKIHDPEVSTTGEIELTEEQAQAFEKYELATIQAWASGGNKPTY